MTETTRTMTTDRKPSSSVARIAAPIESDAPANFVRDIILADLANDKHGGRVVTRFPPEPNGYLHIGHAKAICLDFGVVLDAPTRICHLRFDDTNPVAEDTEFVEAIQRDVKWLGFDWGEKLFYASDYFERLYQFAEELIRKGLAYVCSLPEDQAREMRGSITEPGVPSPDRDLSVDANLALFRRMRAGEFKDGERVLRAKIDMAAANMKMRDPAIYRIRHVSHHRTGDAWCIYPLYDFTHCLSDSLEGITHSLCTVEFESARELYDWFIANLDVPAQPHQYEFAPLNLTYVVVSKRKLRQLVEAGVVSGWDDPRMPTLSGLRRRGFLPEAIRSFIAKLGVAKNIALTDVGRLEAEQRAFLEPDCKRVLAVLDPLPVELLNVPEGQVTTISAGFFPDRGEGPAPSRSLTFSRHIVIERGDFMETPPERWKRLAPGGEVRLRHGFVMRCEQVFKDENGHVTSLGCTVDLETLNAQPADGKRVAGTIQWLSVTDAVRVEVRVIDRLFTVEQPDTPDGPAFTTFVNPESLKVYSNALVEPCVVAESASHERFQFERHGYFWQDPSDSTREQPVFNRIVSLKDSWSKIAQATASGRSEEQQKQEQRAEARRARKEAQAAADRQRTRDVNQEALALAEARSIPLEQAAVLSENGRLLAYFEALVAASVSTRSAASWAVNEIARRLKDSETDPIAPASLGELIALVDEGRLSMRAAKEVLSAMLSSGKPAAQLVSELGLELQADPGALAPLIAQVLAEFPDKVAAYRAGNGNLLGLFVGQVMRRSGGKADPKLVGELLKSALEAPL